MVRREQDVFEWKSSVRAAGGLGSSWCLLSLPEEPRPGIGLSVRPWAEAHAGPLLALFPSKPAQPAQNRTNRRSEAKAGCHRDPRDGRRGENGQLPGGPDRARHRRGLQFGAGPQPRRRADHQAATSRKATSSSRATSWWRSIQRPYRAALEQAQAKKQQDEANVANAKRDLERYQSLAKSDFATRQQLDTQTSQVAQLTAQIAADQAAVDNAQTQLDYTVIKAPIKGRVGFRLVDQGNIVNASSTTGIVEINQIKPIAVIFTAARKHAAGHLGRHGERGRCR